MKKKLLLAMSLLVICLGGCSKGKDDGIIEVKDGAIYNNGVQTSVVSHTGQTAKEPYALIPSLTIEWSWHSDFGNCEHNPAGVAVNNVTKSERDKAITYFSAYGNSQITIHKEHDGGFICGYIYSPEALQADVVINQMSNTLESLVLDNKYKGARMGLIEVTNMSDVIVTKDKIEVPSTLTIMAGNIATTETKEFNKQSVGYLNDSAWDYYQYGDYVIQAMKGYDIGQCVKFLKE